jgi:hypothetical protein
MQRVSDRAAYTVLLAVGVMCVLVFLLVRLPRAEQSVLSADGPGYFSYLRSVLIDGDLDFHNEYEYLGYCKEGDTPSGLICEPYWIQNPTSTGLLGSPLSVGPALLWTPFYLAAHILSLAGSAVGIGVSANGYGYVYESAICIATIAYVTAGTFLAYQVCRRYFAPYSSLLAVLAVCLGSSLLHYTVAAPYMSHGVSFFAVSLFLWLWHPPRSRTSMEWLLLGLAAGVMTLVRWQNLLYLSLIAVEAAQAIRARSDARAGMLEQYVKGVFLMGLAGTPVLLPQLLVWTVLYGTPTQPIGSGFFDWFHPALLEYLFSTRNGLYTWAPILLLATAGLVPLWRRDRRVTVALLAGLLAQWYLNSATSEWWAQLGFGARRFISTTSLLALGMAGLTEWATARLRRGSLIMMVLIATLVGCNFLMELQFSWGFIPPGEAISFHQLTIGKIEMMLELIERAVTRP